MTVLAWDGVTLAADKRCVSGNTIKTTTKIFRLPNGELAGVSGDRARAEEMLQWLAMSGNVSDFPIKRNGDDDFASLLVIDKNGRARRYENAPMPFYFDDKHATAGSGEEGALIAMHLGASSAEAVRIVSLFNTGCGNGVDTLTLDSLADYRAAAR